MTRILLVLLACLTPALAHAQTIDLTTLGATFVDPGGARWYQGTSFPVSTALVEFLRLQGTMTEKGFNTDFRPFPEDATGNTATRSITFSSFHPRIVADATGSHSFYTLLLDVNESVTSGDNYLSLDSLTVYSVPAAGGGALATRTAIASAGTVRYDMDLPVNQVVLIDGNLVAGSGGNDVEIEIPASSFDGVGSGDFIYVALNFGQLGTLGARKYGTSGGFEEIRTYSLPTTGVGETEAVARPWLRIVAEPSSGAARFRYYVPGPGRTRLTLYDLHGRRVTFIAPSDESGGVREIPLLSLPKASGLSSGIYFYEFQWNEARQSGKVALLR
jgi:hypothetical protein